MSDALTDISRDGRIEDKLDEIRMKFFAGEDYSKELEELERMPQGYFYASGLAHAKRIRDGTFDFGCRKPHPQRCHRCARMVREKGILACIPPDAATPRVRIRITTAILDHTNRFGCASFFARSD